MLGSPLILIMSTKLCTQEQKERLFITVWSGVIINVQTKAWKSDLLYRAVLLFNIGLSNLQYDIIGFYKATSIVLQAESLYMNIMKRQLFFNNWDHIT